MSRYNLLALITFVVIYAVSAQIINPPPQNCSANESYSSCGRRCEPTCLNQNPDTMFGCWGFPWLQLCFPPITQGGCRCNTNLVRNNGTCIPPATCVIPVIR